MATLIPSFKKDNPFESINDNELIGLTFNDQDGPSNNILWSSSKIVNLIPKGQFQAKQPNAVSGNFAKFGDENNSGQTIDSGILLDDNADPSSSVIWSSEKIAKIPLPPFQLKQPDAISGNILYLVPMLIWDKLSILDILLMILYHHLLKLFGQVIKSKVNFWLLVKLNSPMQMLVI